MWDVTYEIVTQESSEQGDFEDSGFIAKNISLREAIDLVFETRTSHVDGAQTVDTDHWPMIAPRWVAVDNGMEYLTGEYETRSLHIPENVTPASRRRLARLLGA